MPDRTLRLVPESEANSREGELFEDMLRGYGRMLLAAGRERESVGKALLDIRNFVVWADAWPWEWSAHHIDEWSADMRDRELAKGTIRHRQGTIRRFCGYLTNPSYEWTERCASAFGAQPQQVCHEWNTTRHIEDYEGDPARRELTRDELRRLFDHVDDRVERMVTENHKGAAIAWRDAVMLKVHYGTGVRPGELVRLQTCDLVPHPVASQFGRYAVIRVRHGKRSRGGPARQRGVQMVMDWVVEALRQYVEDVRPALPDGPWLWPSERRDARGRQQPISTRTYREQFAARRDEAGLEPVLTPHCLRHSWQTHMAERGRDPLWRQRQAGHKFLSTTSIYTHVGAEQMNREMAAAIADLTGQEEK
ncbi:MAG: tyrosine-type recombinase/integrase [Acidimicrobiales bacterium]